MAEYYFSVNLDNDRTLCIAPITDEMAASAEPEIEDASGYFLFERRGSDDASVIEILAHLASEEAALRLRDMFKMS